MPGFEAAANNMIMRENGAGITEFNLGTGNAGAFGPDAETIAQWGDMAGKIANRRYVHGYTGVWKCGDGRGTKAEQTGDAHGYGQTWGSLALANTAGDLMDPYIMDQPLSHAALVADNTAEEVESGKTIFVHGDDHARKAGCKANAAMRDVLLFAEAHADVIVPRALALGWAAGLKKLINAEDLRFAIMAGATRAQTPNIWDASPSKITDISLENGAKYQELVGAHREIGYALTTDMHDAYDARKFAAENPGSQGNERQLFVGTAGIYVATTMEDGARRRMDERDAALKAGRGLLWLVTVPKAIGTESLSGVIVPAA